MSLTKFLPTLILMAACIRPVAGEELNLELSPPAVPSGHWLLRTDKTLDNRLAHGAREQRVAITTSNDRFTAEVVASGKASNSPSPSIFSGSIIRGVQTVVTIRQDTSEGISNFASPRFGYTAIYTGRLGDSGNITGVYYDNRGISGDWSLSPAPTEEPRTPPSPLTIAPLQQELPNDKLVESVLGVYGKAIRGKRHPFVNLKPPARDLWTGDIEEIVGGTLPYAQVDYIATALLIAPKSGDYRIDLPDSGVELKLNGQRVAKGDVHLKKGLYQVELYTNHWGQPYLKYAHARVILKSDNQPIPFVNTQAAVASFLQTKINGSPVVQVSKYQPRTPQP